MAVNFAAAPATNTFAQPLYANQFSNYPSQQPSPQSSQSTTPDSFSPTSPNAGHVTHRNNPSRQLRPPKKPLYVPAVLRPTERPSRYSPPKHSAASSPVDPMTPPSSSSNSSQQLEPLDDDQETTLRKILGGGVVSAGVTRIVTDEWNEKRLEPVTGSPTKDHWKPDDAVSACDLSTCSLPFNMLRRRHHCRRCGNIFCADHARAQVPLDQHARFHPKGFEERACDDCAKDFRFWRKAMTMKRRFSIDSSAAPSGASSPVAQSVPGTEDQLLEEQGPEGSKNSRVAGDVLSGSFVGSLGNLGSWSTF